MASPAARAVSPVRHAKLHASMDDLGGEILSMKNSTPSYPRWLTIAYAAAYYLTCRLVVHCIYSRGKLDLDLLHLVICCGDRCQIFRSTA